MIVLSGIIIICNIKKLLKEKKRIIALLKSTLFAMSITAIFWMPMLEQLCMSKTKIDELKEIYNPANWTLDFCKMFFGTEQYEYALTSAYGLGIIFIIILPFRLIIKKQNSIMKICDILILIGLFLLVFMTKVFPWKYIPKIGEMIQFQSRLEIIVSAVFSVAVGMICENVLKGNLKLEIIIFVIILIWQSVFDVYNTNVCISDLVKEKNVKTKEELKINENFEYYLCDEIFLPAGSSYMEAMFSEEKIKSNSENIKYEYDKKGLSIKISFSENKERNTYIDIPLYYYYGYVAKPENNDKEYKIERAENGVIRVFLDDVENDNIVVYYKTTTVQKIGIIVTTITTIGSMIYFFKMKRKRTIM